MYSDNGTNFKGADAELKSLVTKLDDVRITQSVANKGVTWYFKLAIFRRYLRYSITSVSAPAYLRTERRLLGEYSRFEEDVAVYR